MQVNGTKNEVRPLFSVIVPCCDVADYLPEMWDSLRTQTYQNFECLLVVETSKDQTGKICASYCEQDSRFRLFVQSRSGSPATPRNTGIRNARGEYVVFLDGDDWLEVEALSNLAGVLSSHDHPDALVIGAREFSQAPEGALTFVRDYYNFPAEDDGRLLDGETAARQMIDFRSGLPWPMVWLYVCRLDFLLEHELWQRDGLVHEDQEWFPRLCSQVRTLVPVNRVLYYYRRRPGSITTERQTEDDLMSLARGLRLLLEFFCGRNLPDGTRRLWTRVLTNMLFSWFFAQKIQACIPNRIRWKAVHSLFAGDGARLFRQVMRSAAPSKRIVVPLLFWGHLPLPAAMIPANLFFNYGYYPFVTRKTSK